MDSAAPRIGIIVVAYNAATTLAQVLDRIPRWFVPQISDVLVCDDASQDATFLVGLGYQQLTDLPLTVIRRDQNLGYGGNQKAGYRWAIDAGLDIVVLLHGDGQYAPELLPEIVRPLEEGDADAVFGSRMLEPGRARQGGMPLYKYLANAALNVLENRTLGLDMTDYHSGYLVYGRRVRQRVPFARLSDSFDFDLEVIASARARGLAVAEEPVPTHYGDELSHLRPIPYGARVLRVLWRYRRGDYGPA